MLCGIYQILRQAATPADTTSGQEPQGIPYYHAGSRLPVSSMSVHWDNSILNDKTCQEQPDREQIRLYVCWNLANLNGVR